VLIAYKKLYNVLITNMDKEINGCCIFMHSFVYHNISKFLHYNCLCKTTKHSHYIHQNWNSFRQRSFVMVKHTIYYICQKYFFQNVYSNTSHCECCDNTISISKMILKEIYFIIHYRGTVNTSLQVQ